MKPVSVEAFDIFSQGEIPECDSCGVNSDCESGTWSSALVSNDVCVPPSFAVEVVGVGEMSDSGWEFGSGCGSVSVSGVLVVPDVGETNPSVVTVMCEGVPSDSEWDFVEPQSFSFSKKRDFRLCGTSELPQQRAPLRQWRQSERGRVASASQRHGLGCGIRAKTMHEENFLGSCLREDGREKEKERWEWALRVEEERNEKRRREERRDPNGESQKMKRARFGELWWSVLGRPLGEA